MKLLRQILIITVVGYGAIVGALYFGQRSLVFAPSSNHVAPANLGLQNVDEITLVNATPD